MAKTKPTLIKHLHKPVPATWGWLILLVAVIIVGSIMVGVKKTKDTAERYQNQNTAPTDTPTPPVGPKVTFHVNSTTQWATYTSPDIPISIQFPPQWKYRDSTDEMSRGDHSDIYVTDTEKKGPASFVIFSPVSTQDSSYSENINISWNGTGNEDPSYCTTHPSIQLKNEVLSACEYTFNGSIDKIQVVKDTPTFNFSIDTNASSPTAKAEILNILSTLSFTK